MPRPSSAVLLPILMVQCPSFELQAADRSQVPYCPQTQRKGMAAQLRQLVVASRACRCLAFAAISLPRKLMHRGMDFNG